MPAPSLDRAEVSTRLACADVQGSSLPLDVDRAAWAAQVVATADAIVLALTPPVAPEVLTPDVPEGSTIAQLAAEQRASMNPTQYFKHTAPVAPKSEAAKYEPRVGDVVRFVVYGATNGDGVVVAIQREGVASIRLFGESVHALTWGRYFKDLAYLRPATPAERAAAGLPSPEATRPTHVRVTGPTGARFVTIGKTYRVIDRDEDCERLVILNDDDERWLLGQPGEINPAFPTWEPATPPAPVEPAKPGTVENMAAHLAWCAWCGTDGRSELPYDAFRAGYLAALAARGAP